MKPKRRKCHRYPYINHSCSTRLFVSPSLWSQAHASRSNSDVNATRVKECFGDMSMDIIKRVLQSNEALRQVDEEKGGRMPICANCCEIH